MRRLIDWLVGKPPGGEPVEQQESAADKRNIFLGRDLDKPTPESVKVVRWSDAGNSGSNTTTGRR